MREGKDPTSRAVSPFDQEDRRAYDTNTEMRSESRTIRRAPQATRVILGAFLAGIAISVIARTWKKAQ